MLSLIYSTLILLLSILFEIGCEIDAELSQGLGDAHRSRNEEQ